MSKLVAKFLGLAALGGTVALAAPAMAQGNQPVKIGILADMNSAYSALGGMGSVESVRMAVADFGGSVLGKPVEVIFADGQNKPDVAAGIARKWYDEGVDVIVEMPTSAIALAVAQVAREQKKIALVTSAASSDITGQFCSPYTVHWATDTYAFAHSTAAAVVQRGGKSWYFIAPDYALGASSVRDATDVVTASGGKVLGGVKHPFGAMDYSSNLLQAQSSKAEVIGVASAGNDLVNLVKQAVEYNIRGGGQTLAALVASISDIRSIGLANGQGIYLTEPVYWDQNNETRAWSQRFLAKMNRMPSQTQAGIYGAVQHYLKAVQAKGSKDADTVLAQMRAMPINDFMTKNGTIRIDGRVLRDLYLFQVKKPADSKSEWDLYEQIATIPANDAFRPLKDGNCPLVK